MGWTWMERYWVTHRESRRLAPVYNMDCFRARSMAFSEGPWKRLPVRCICRNESHLDYEVCAMVSPEHLIFLSRRVLKNGRGC